MPKFSRFIFGGLMGAGLALLFAPKPGRELRRLLMGGGRPALPPPEAETAGAPVDRASLDSRIEETRRQVETQLGEEAAPGAPEGEAVIGKTSEPQEAKALVTGSETPPAEAAEEPPKEKITTAGEAGEELEAAAMTAAEEEDFVVEEAPPEEAAQEEAAEAGETAAGGDGPVEPWEEEIAELKTPAAGEPEVGESEEEAETTSREEEPAAEAPVDGRPEPSGFDQEEMRRRIDVTRARLKAKAFDAMVSGETFIETEADKAGKKEQPAGPPLEEEVEKQIDESLKEEE